MSSGQNDSDQKWVKSRFSNPSGNCVEVTTLANGEIGMRNSRKPDSTLSHKPGEMAAFIRGAKAGEFDYLIP